MYSDDMRAPQRWLANAFFAAYPSVLPEADLGMVCPHPDCGDCPKTLIADCTATGLVTRMSSKMPPDARCAAPYALDGARPQDMFFITGAAGMRVFSKLLYRLVRPPALPGKSAKPCPANEGPLVSAEFDNVAWWLQAAKGTTPAVAQRMRALAALLLHLKVFFRSDGDLYRCPDSWAHLLYPLCMPSTLWVSHRPTEQAAILRELKQRDAVDPSDAGNALRQRVQIIAPHVADFLVARNIFEFPEVR